MYRQLDKFFWKCQEGGGGGGGKGGVKLTPPSVPRKNYLKDPSLIRVNQKALDADPKAIQQSMKIQ